jgi:hypothetical protein
MCEVVIYEVVIVICGDLSDNGGKGGGVTPFEGRCLHYLDIG